MFKIWEVKKREINFEWQVSSTFFSLAPFPLKPVDTLLQEAHGHA